MFSIAGSGISQRSSRGTGGTHPDAAPSPTNPRGSPTPATPATSGLPNISRSARDNYGQVYVPGAQRALQMLQQGQGFNPIDLPGVADLDPRMNYAMRHSYNMAQVNRANDIGREGINQLGAIADANGMAAGTSGNMGVLDRVASGQRAINTDTAYRRMSANPLTDMQRSAGDVYSGVAQGGEGDVASGRFRSLYGEAGDPTNSEANLQRMATMRPGRNPYLDQLETLVNDQIRAEVARGASASGRYGSGMMGGQLADAISRNVLQGRLAQYNADSDRQLAANNQMDNQRMARLGMSRGLAGDIANLDASNIDRRLGAADRQAALGQQAFTNRMGATDALTNVQGANIANQVNTAQAAIDTRQQGQQDAMRAIALRPEMNNARFADVDRMLNYASPFQERDQARLDQDRADALQREQSGWDRLNAYMAAINGTGSAAGNVMNYNAQENALRAQRPSGFAQTIGTIGAVGGLLNQTGLLGPLARGASSVAGSLIGGLF